MNYVSVYIEEGCSVVNDAMKVCVSVPARKFPVNGCGDGPSVCKNSLRILLDENSLLNSLKRNSVRKT